MADRVGRFTPVRLGLRCRSEEAGRTGEGESGGRVAASSLCFARNANITAGNVILVAAGCDSIF